MFESCNCSIHAAQVTAFVKFALQHSSIKAKLLFYEGQLACQHLLS